MNREIKFRGVHENQNGGKQFVFGLPSHYLPNSTAYYNTHSHRICWHLEGGGQANAPILNGTLSQFTGIKDKNGVDIYEGDLLKLDAKEWGGEHTDTVEWNYSLFDMRKNDWPQWCEVVGNIYDVER